MVASIESLIQWKTARFSPHNGIVIGLVMEAVLESSSLELFLANIILATANV